jgi:hypothetical protein
MKTLIKNENNWSLYIFEDEDPITINSDSINCSFISDTTPDFIIGDLNASNATMVENVTPPSDWAGCKYIYDNSTWTLNPQWVDPSA